MKAFILALSSLFFTPVALAQQDSSPTPSEKIKVLSWNIYMLPGFLGEGKRPRAEAIGQLLATSDYDVIVFQEAFHHRACKIIRQALSKTFPYEAGPANQKLVSLKTNSGIWIFSRYPITAAHSITFQTRHGIDAMSRKGALMVEINIHNFPIQIVGTHLQNAGDESLRQRQCAELYDLLLKRYERPGVPQIVCGDFNIKRQTAHYAGMLQQLDADDGALTGEIQYSYDRLHNDLQVEKGMHSDLIDYILVRHNQSQVNCHEKKIKPLRKHWDATHQDLSDHYSLEAEIHFQSTAAYYTASRYE
ncbi:MAG: sphingomyelin phosphodiesterase [Cyclobacteriaceae bacterium]|nr:sphingomyelin phosphodiesterase [Cyclobacteriaceae bacterium]